MSIESYRRPIRRCRRSSPFGDESELISDERCSAFSSRNNSAEPPVPSNTGPLESTFFDYAAHHWEFHLGNSPVGFSLDDVLKLARPTSARQRAWAIESGLPYWQDQSVVTATLSFLVSYRNVSMLNQLLDRLAPDGDGDRSTIVAAATKAIRSRKPGLFRALINHQSTAMAMQTVEMLKTFIDLWNWFSNDDRKEWAKLITGLFDTLASDTIPSPNYLLWEACVKQCIRHAGI